MTGTSTTLSESASKALLRHYGVPMADEREVHDALKSAARDKKEAGKAARRPGGKEAAVAIRDVMLSSRDPFWKTKSRT